MSNVADVFFLIFIFLLLNTFYTYNVEMCVIFSETAPRALRTLFFGASAPGHEGPSPTEPHKA